MATYCVVGQAASGAAQPYKPPNINEPPEMEDDADNYRTRLMRYTEIERKLETISKVKGELSSIFTETFARRYEQHFPCRYGSDVLPPVFMTRIVEMSKNPILTDAQRKRDFQNLMMNVKQELFQSNITPIPIRKMLLIPPRKCLRIHEDSSPFIFEMVSSSEIFSSL